jgi:hypothetical protein
LIEKILRSWCINDRLPEKIDVIVPISYGATISEMTKSSLLVSKEASRIAHSHAEAKIVWGSYSKSPRPGLERRWKSDILEDGGNETAFVGNVSSTTDECQLIKRKLMDLFWRSRKIVVVAEGCHSRRAKKVWEYFFPNSEICFRSIDPREAEDQSNPMIFQKHWLLWFIFNLALYPLYLGNGVRQMAKWNFSQPTL